MMGSGGESGGPADGRTDGHEGRGRSPRRWHDRCRRRSSTTGAGCENARRPTARTAGRLSSRPAVCRRRCGGGGGRTLAATCSDAGRSAAAYRWPACDSGKPGGGKNNN